VALPACRQTDASADARPTTTPLSDGRVKFSFTALEIGHLVDAEFDVVTADGHFNHGIITCFWIGPNANEAVIGGQLTQMASGPIPGHPERVFRVVDNRPPRTNDPDQISFLFRPVEDLGLIDAGEFCDPDLEGRPDLPLMDVVSGNVTVRDNPPMPN